jgi:hypothetical protein
LGGFATAGAMRRFEEVKLFCSGRWATRPKGKKASCSAK